MFRKHEDKCKFDIHHVGEVTLSKKARNILNVRIFVLHRWFQ